MEQSQPTFTISSQLNKQCSPLPLNANPGGRACQTRHVVLDMHIFSNLAEKEKETWQPGLNLDLMRPAIGRCILL